MKEQFETDLIIKAGALSQLHICVVTFEKEKDAGKEKRSVRDHLPVRVCTVPGLHSNNSHTSTSRF